MSDPITVVMIEDQPALLKAQLKLLDEMPGVSVVGSAMSGETGTQLIINKRPHVALVDMGLPDISGTEVTRRVKQASPSTEVLIFTVFDDEDKVLEAVQAGASGYLLKGVSQAKLLEALQEVRAGGSVIQPNLARRLLQHFNKVPAPAPSHPASPRPFIKPLSPRELEILQFIAKGVSNTEAASALQISKATIRTHLEHIYQKLDVTNRVEAVTEAIRHGIISVKDE